MSTAKKTFPVSWEKLHEDARILAKKVAEGNSKWKGIVAITRGGLIPTSILATELEIRTIETLCIASYAQGKYEHQDDRGKLELLKDALNINQGRGWLMIDDLVDTGETASLARDILPFAHFATLYAKPDGIPMVDTFITEVPQDTWVIFPWDA